MIKRPRPFPCSIAGKTVSIALRSGQRLLERGKPYVGCSERDCQYVDLNVLPCPLDVAMFEDGQYAAALLAHLATVPRRAFCYGCLVDQLGISHESLRRAAWLLREDVGASIRPARCASCRRRALTISVRDVTLPATPPAISVEQRGLPVVISRPATNDPAVNTQRVVLALSKTGERALCAACLAFASELPLAHTRHIVGDLDLQQVVLVRAGACAVCGRDETVATLKSMAFSEDSVSRGGPVVRAASRGWR